MTCEIHRFDPSTYDARNVHKPLGQLMREAEAYRSQEVSRMVAALWARVKRAFTGGHKEPWQEEAEQDTRLAA